MPDTSANASAEAGTSTDYAGCVYDKPPARFGPQYSYEDLSAHQLAGMRLTGLPLRDSHAAGEAGIVGTVTDEWQSPDGSKCVLFFPCL